MIKSLKDARIIDGLPGIVAQQPWVKAFSKAMGVLHEKTLGYIDDSQIYTAIDKAAEPVLDTMAVNWKIDWYDTGYSIEQKRRIVKTALTIRRTMGTVGAVKSQADAIYPGTTLEEWFEWGGKPGLFRLNVDVTTTGPGNTIDIHGQAEIERRLTTAKRYSAHMESMSYQIRHGIKVSERAEGWTVRPPICGMIRCGTYHSISTLGWTEDRVIAVEAVPEAFAASPELCGTLPEISALGHSLYGELRCAGAAAAYEDMPPVSGMVHSGALPRAATVGGSMCGVLQSGGKTVAAAYAGVPSISGLARCGTRP